MYPYLKQLPNLQLFGITKGLRNTKKQRLRKFGDFELLREYNDHKERKVICNFYCLSQYTSILDPDRYEVEAILNKHNEYYQVKWKGYKKTQWLPSENLDSCIQLLEDFHKTG